MEFALGDKVKDTVSGVAAIVIGRTVFLHGCVRLLIQPQGLHEGKPIEAFSIDEPQCVLVAKAAVPSYQAPPARAEPIGRRAGPRPDVTRAQGAKR